MTMTIIAAIAACLSITLVLVALLLFVKAKITPSGSVKIDINNGSKELEVTVGSPLPEKVIVSIFVPSSASFTNFVRIALSTSS